MFQRTRMDTSRTSAPWAAALAILSLAGPSAIAAEARASHGLRAACVVEVVISCAIYSTDPGYSLTTTEEVSKRCGSGSHS
jgi:hypothetical protein